MSRNWFKIGPVLTLSTFVASYQQSLKIQEQLSQNRIRFATRLNEMCDEMLGLAREGERQRKMVSLTGFPAAPQLIRSTKRTASDIRLHYRKVMRSWRR